ncbi:MAG: citrate synthase [Proteobacteria bacterium]|nr:citrate synthase [Pseudomonadota bacterium]
MSEDSLFNIKEEHLDSGLRGIPVGHVRTSKVDPYEGVSYVGQPIGELAQKDPEAVIFLLLNKRMPESDELAAFKRDIQERSQVDQRVLDVLAALPKDGHPMEWFITGLSLLGMTGKSTNSNTQEAYKEDALNAISRIPTVVAAIFRLRHGWGDPIESRPELGLVENFVHMLGVPGGNTEALTELLRTFYILHMDHGGGNLSTFTGKAVASGLADIYAALGAAMSGLYGPLHGRANQDCLNFVRSVGTSNPDELDAKLTEILRNGGKVFGFGHAVLRAEDPRATVQYALGQNICPDDPLFKTALTMREVAVKVIKREKPQVSSPYPNVDAVSGTLLNASGLTDSDYYTVLFGLARCSGIAAQIVDERTDLRFNKKKNKSGPVPIYRCKYIFQKQN